MHVVASSCVTVHLKVPVENWYTTHGTKNGEGTGKESEIGTYSAMYSEKNEASDLGGGDSRFISLSMGRCRHSPL